MYLSINEIAELSNNELWQIWRLHRFGSFIFCPECRQTKIKIIKKNPDGKCFYQCHNCIKTPVAHFQFNDLTGTFLSNFNLSIKKIFLLFSFYIRVYAIFDKNFIMKEVGIAKNTFYKIKEKFEQIITIEDNLKKFAVYPSIRKVCINEKMLFGDNKRNIKVFELDYYQFTEENRKAWNEKIKTEKLIDSFVNYEQFLSENRKKID